ncbi:unnamed protein product [Rotaria sordida]|uniref:HAT C-terminal dimerisation domain-containing protein n=2 Tax=Rotaria sordida TaxID=392033 RepID=A0A814X810_9BILA|nr:unnamed protein product [Rotaria sordida]
MKQKLSRKNIKKIENIVDHNDDQNDELIIVTAQTNFLSMSNSMNDPDSNASILNSINSNETNTDISNATPTLLAQQNSGGRKLTSKVWLYAKKSDDGQEASCLLCDYTCSCQSHSTSTIRQHLIIKHNKLDLILKSSSVLAKVKISEALKNELHQLCYYAIIKDGRPFNDLNKMGIIALINKLCPGFWVSDKKKHIDEPGYSSANILTSNTTTSNTTTSYTTTSNATDQEIEQENMDVEWDLELNDDSWNINGVDLIDETDTYDTINATANTEFSETTYFYDDEIINEQDIIELMNDSWSNVTKDLIDLTQAQKLILQVVKKCRAIAKILKKSSLISRFVRKEQDSMKSKKNISNDCPSRWNSTFNLIDAIIELKHVIIKLFTDKWSLNLRKDQVSKLAKIELTSENWDLLSALHFVLKPFFLATKMMSGKEYATIGLSYYAIHEIKSFCAKEEKCTEQSKTFKRLLVEKLNKYFYSNSEQIHHLQRLAYFDPTSHLCLNDKEKQQNENYIRKLITDDVYPLESSSNDNLTSSSSLSAQIQVKPSVFDEFMAACGQEDIILTGNMKEKSKRISINEELKYFKQAVQQYNAAVQPSTRSAKNFWKAHKDRLPLLTHLAKIHLSACATSVPSESAFSQSSFIGRKERNRITGEHLAYSVFLKDKL